MLKKIVTDDGSVSFHNSEYDEHYHTKSGAEEESFKKHVEPCNIRELAKKGKIRILDVCFGLGYNTAAAIDVAKEVNPDCRIEVVALENDQEIIDKMYEITTNFKSFDTIKHILKTKEEKNNIKITLLLDDAKESIKDVKEKFDVVFFDPFSPQKHPQMWTEKFFKDIISTMKPGAKLSTYSCARIVRENLKKAGFTIEDGPVVGRRSPSTIAKVANDDTTLGQEQENA